jgi:outer membrane protein OmpA-like peptidoglycan-associated protein
MAGNPLQVTPGMLTGATRGIVPARPATPSSTTLASSSAPVAAASVTNPCPAGSGVCDLYIEFETGSATLTPDAIVVLNNLGKALDSLKDKRFHFRVEGHTDTVGGEQFNLALSAQRADAVTLYLSSHFGVDPAALEPVGMGKDHPLVATPDQTPEPRNRRVQVINVGA